MSRQKFKIKGKEVKKSSNEQKTQKVRVGKSKKKIFK